MEFLLKKKLNPSLYKTLHKIYDDDYDKTGKLDNKLFNEYILVLVKSGLKKNEIKELLRKTVDGEDTEFSFYINENNKLNTTTTLKDIVVLILFGIIFTIMFLNLFI